MNNDYRISGGIDVENQEEAVWIYYTNDEGKARWKCSNCKKICKHNPYYKRYCSQCGKRIRLQS